MDKKPFELPDTNRQSPFASMKLAHVCIRTTEYAPCKQWYMDKLDFRLLHEWEYNGLQVAYYAPPANDEFWFEIIAGGRQEPQPRYGSLAESMSGAGYHHVCINVDDIEATIAELRRRGVTVVEPAFELEAIGRKLAFFTDPWGNMLELAEVGYKENI